MASKPQEMDPSLTQPITRLKTANVPRENLVTTLFKSEIFRIVLSISTDGRTLFHATKSDILKLLEKYGKIF